MRERHFPRLCRSCGVPMARQESTCWACGAEWVTAKSALADNPPAPVVRAVLYDRVVVESDPDEDRWVNEGGRGRPGVRRGPIARRHKEMIG